jgi:hypothetical protein
MLAVFLKSRMELCSFKTNIQDWRAANGKQEALGLIHSTEKKNR